MYMGMKAIFGHNDHNLSRKSVGPQPMRAPEKSLLPH